MGNICQICQKGCIGQVVLQCKHPICSNCAHLQLSFAILRNPVDISLLKTGHKKKGGNEKSQDEKKTLDFCCPVCTEKSTLVLSKGIVKLLNSRIVEPLYIPDEIFQWMFQRVFQFFGAKELFKKIRFTCKRINELVSTSLLSLHCQGMGLKMKDFARPVLRRQTQLQQLNLAANNIDNYGVKELTAEFSAL